ncbi:MFS transporter [Chloroflexota bacterium]
MDSNRKPPRVFYGWYIVGACLLMIIYNSGIVHYGFTAVIEPLAQEFGWSYAQISLAASLRGLEVGLLAPVLGYLVDRRGPRQMVFGGSIVVCAGFVMLSRVSSLTMFYGAFALIAIGTSAFTQTIMITAVVNWFRKKAKIAIGIVACGFGLGGLIVPLVTELIDLFQWRMAMAVVGLGMLVIVLPLSFVVRNKPERYGHHPDCDLSSTVDATVSQISESKAEVNFTALQAIKTRAFWHVAIASLCHSFVIGAIITHIMPYLSSIGIARSLSSLVALVLSVLSISGRLGSGWLAGRFGSKQVFATSFALLTFGLLLFGNVTAGMMWLLIPVIITLSLGWGLSVTMRLSLLRDYFGRANYGTILGFLSGMMMLGNMSGAPLAGWVFDTWGSYKSAWLGFCVLTISGLVLALTMPSSVSTIQQLGTQGNQPTIK